MTLKRKQKQRSKCEEIVNSIINEEVYYDIWDFILDFDIQ